MSKCDANYARSVDIVHDQHESELQPIATGITVAGKPLPVFQSRNWGSLMELGF